MRTSRRWIALLVLATFLAQALGAVNFFTPPRAWAQVTPSSGQPAALFAQSAAQIESLLGSIQEKSGQGLDVSLELQQIQSAAQTLQSTLASVQTQLDSAAQVLEGLVQQGQVPADVVAELAAFRASFDTASADLLSRLAALQASPVDQGQLDAARAALNVLTSPPAPTMTELAPAKLPHRRADIPRRGLQARAAITPGQTPPGAADLSPTVDAQITPEIQALAAQNNFDPATLFAFVRNTIEFEPYFGSLKGSPGTLLEKAGNDIDQASLLIALLRASNVPARYVAGAVEVPIVKAMNWVGVETAPAAVEVFARNGFPFEVRASADGTITHLAFFHVWAEAFIAQGPGGGAAGRRQWVQLDPGFKQHDFTTGIDLTSAVGFDATAFFQGLTSGATLDQSRSFFTSLNEAFVGAEVTREADNLVAAAETAFGPSPTTDQVIGARTIRAISRQELNTLAQSFPFKTFTPQLEFPALPDTFRHQLNLAMFGFSKLFALAELAGRRVTVTYVAATPHDQALIDARGGILNVFPAFIVNLIPQLRVEGQLVAEGQGVPLGSSQVLRSAFRRPLETGFDVNDKIVTTGATDAITLNLQRVSLPIVQARMERFRQLLISLGPTPPRTEPVVGESLHLSGLAYWAETDNLSDIAARPSKVVFTREPSEAVLVQGLRVLFLFGVPFIVQEGSVNVDVKRNIISPTSSVGDPRAEVAWMIGSGTIGSAAEHGVFEQLYQTPSVSTIRILSLANSRGVPIFTIDRANVDTILPQLDTFDIVKQNIRQFVDAGFMAIVPQRNVRFNSWLGMGWIVVDVSTGSAGYFIAGSLTTGTETTRPVDGLAGGETSQPTDTERFERCLASGQVHLNVGCFLAINAAAVTVTAPLVVGVVVGAIAFSRGNPFGAGLAISSAALLSLIEVNFYNSCQEADPDCH